MDFITLPRATGATGSSLMSSQWWEQELCVRGRGAGFMGLAKSLLAEEVQ